MEVDRVVNRLAEHLVSARERLSRDRAEGRAAEATEEVVRSLRLTLAWVLREGNPRSGGEAGFACAKDALGDLIVRFRGSIIGVSGRHLEELLRQAGVELAAGERLWLTPALGKILVEEALARNGYHEAVLRREKAALRSAYLAAERLERGGDSPFDGEAA